MLSAPSGSLCRHACLCAEGRVWLQDACSQLDLLACSRHWGMCCLQGDVSRTTGDPSHARNTLCVCVCVCTHLRLQQPSFVHDLCRAKADVGRMTLQRLRAVGVYM